MQQTKLFIYKLFTKVLFPCENQGVTLVGAHKMLISCANMSSKCME
jgi:hypothetical protein